MEIIFRGKTKQDVRPSLKECIEKGTWVYGDLLRYNDGEKQHTCIYHYGDIDPKTIGQFTGLTDKNGKNIFEGDIVKYKDGFGVIKWAGIHCAFMCVEENGKYWEWMSNMHEIEVLGNIHDNPELLEVDNE